MGGQRRKRQRVFHVGPYGQALFKLVADTMGRGSPGYRRLLFWPRDMIFATVGTQLVFPRLVESLRYLVEEYENDVFAQTIDQEYEYQAKGRLICVKQLAPQAFDDRFSASRLVISHAGIGSIISASRFQKPIILVPRQAELKEHRNNHQADTANRFTGSTGIYVANDARQIAALCQSPLDARPALDPASSSLIGGIRDFIFG